MAHLLPVWSCMVYQARLHSLLMEVQRRGGDSEEVRWGGDARYLLTYFFLKAGRGRGRVNGW